MSEDDILTPISNLVKRTTTLTLENLMLHKKLNVFTKALYNANMHFENINYENVDWKIAYQELFDIIHKAEIEMKNIV